MLVTPIVGAAVLVALLAQRRSSTRADLDETASWRLTDEVRALDPAALRLGGVRALRVGLFVALAAGVVAIPLLLRSDQIIKASAVAAFSIVGLSLVVLTGWAGQISLGQMAFVGIGATVSAKCTSTWNVDLTLSLLAGGLAGAIGPAIVVGLPALRLRGLYLAVTTLVFTLAVTSWMLNDRFFGWVPASRLERPPLFGRIELDTPTRYYIYSVAVLGLVFGALHAASGTVDPAGRSSRWQATSEAPRRTASRRSGRS